MDYVRLVEDENRPEYKMENLNPEDATFIEGIEDAIEMAGTWFNTLDFDDKDIFEQIRKQCYRDAVEELKEYMYVTKCEYVVQAIDYYEESSEGEDVREAVCDATL